MTERVLIRCVRHLMCLAIHGPHALMHHIEVFGGQRLCRQHKPLLVSCMTIGDIELQESFFIPLLDNIYVCSCMIHMHTHEGAPLPLWHMSVQHACHD